MGRINNARTPEALIQSYNNIKNKSRYCFNPRESIRQDDLTVENMIVETEEQDNLIIDNPTFETEGL